MNDEDWQAFVVRLFVEYPSLHDRLQRTAVDYDATLAHWQKKLSRFSASELHAVLDFWDKSNINPWDSYTVEQAVAIIANVAMKARDARSAKVEAEHIREVGRKPQRSVNGEQVTAYACFDGSMKAAFERLRPVHRKFKDGEISQVEYFLAKDEAIHSLG